MQIESICTKDIDDVWPFIADGVQEIVDNMSRLCPNELELHTVDVFEKLINGERLLLLLLDDYEILKGFFLINVTTVNDKRVLIPHCIYLKEWLKEFTGLSVRVFKDLAIQYKCDEINIFTTTHPGWLDWFKEYGFVDGGTMDVSGAEHMLFKYDMRNG